MTTTAQLRKAAMHLPEAKEGTQRGKLAFFVHDKVFASLTADGVQLRLPAERVREFLAEHGVGEPVLHGGNTIGLRVPLSAINGMVLNALVRAAWVHRAPKHLAQKLAGAADPDRTDDLPAAAGNPSRRALREAGVTSLAQLTSWSRAQLSDLHGVGPAAIRVLERSLADRGLSLR